MVIHNISPKAYRAIRKVLYLPSVATIRRCFSNYIEDYGIRSNYVSNEYHRNVQILAEMSHAVRRGARSDIIGLAADAFSLTPNSKKNRKTGEVKNMVESKAKKT